MAKQEPPSPQSIPSTDFDTPKVPVDSLETTLDQLEARASVTTTVLQEILARSGDNYYVHHWGINE